MVGWHLLLLLLVEVALYGAIGTHVHTSWAWPIGAAIALAVGIYIWVRMLLVGFEFILARRTGDSIPTALRVPAVRLVAMYLRELGGWLLMFSLILPFVTSRRSVMDRPAAGTPSVIPVILVHGLACNRGYWFWFRRQLELRGYRAFAVDCTPWYARIDSLVPLLSHAIDEVLAATSSQQVVVIGHSMGGLVTRAYLARIGCEKIAHVITLGTPHQGTWMARFGYAPSIHDMATASAWLASLRARELQRDPTPYAKFTCLFSYHDNLVTPQRNATLPGATEIALSGIGHVSLALSPAVLDAVSQALAQVNRTTA